MSKKQQLSSQQSEELLKTLKDRFEKNKDRMKELWTCRTPQDFAAVQSDMMRETVEIALESSRRAADMSRKMVEDAGEQIKHDMEEFRRSA